MATSIITGAVVSSSLASTASFGEVKLPDKGEIKFGNDVNLRIHHDGSNNYIANQIGGLYIRQNANNANIFIQSDDGSGGTTTYQKFDGTEESIIFSPPSGKISGSLISTGSFGKLRVMGLGSSVAPRFDIDDAGNQVISGSDATLTIRYGGNATATQPGFNINGGNLMMIGAGKEVLRASSNGDFTVNENGVDVNTRIETADNANLVMIDGAKNHMSIGMSRGNHTSDEILVVAGNTGITGSLHVSGNISTSGSIIAKEFRTEFVNQIIATSSGSTTFGDGLDDVHRFTGSVNITGSITIPTGSLDVRGGVGGSNIARFSRNVGTTRTDIDIHAGSGDPQITFSTPSRDFSIGASAGGHEFRISEHTAIGTNNRLIVRDDGDVFISQSLDFRAEHAADKIVLYNGGNEKIGTSAHTLILTATSHSFKDTDGHENFKIGPTGNAELLATGKLYFDGGTHTFITETSDDNLTIAVGGTNLLDLVEDSTDYVRVRDNTLLGVGSSNDLHFKHDGTDSFIDNGNGNLTIRNQANDKDVILQSDDGSGGVTAYITLDGSATLTSVHKDMRFDDSEQLQVGAGADAKFYHDGSNTYLDNTGANNFIIQQSGDDQDLVFRCDDGSGGVTSYITLDGSISKTTLGKGLRAVDDVKFTVGNADDASFYHDATDTYIENGTGTFYIRQLVNDGDLIFQCDNGSGGNATYLTLDGGAEKIIINKNMRFADSVDAMFGAGEDLKIKHDATNSIINNTTGDLHISQSAQDKDIKFTINDGGTKNTIMTIDGSAGKIGIGTTSPSDLLHLNSTSGDVRMVLNSPDGSDAEIKFFNNGSSVYTFGYDDASGNMRLGTANVDTSIIFEANASGISGSLGSTGSFNSVAIPDGGKAVFGASEDIQIYHNGGGNSNFENHSGDLYFTQYTNDGDIFFRTDDGSGGVANYIQIDGGSEYVFFHKDIALKAAEKLYLDGGGNTYIHETSGDDLEIVVGGTTMISIDQDDNEIKLGTANVSQSLSFFGRPESPAHMGYGQANRSSEGWYRIARMGTVADGSSNGTRASAKFTVYDTDSSRHSVVTFYASIHFGSNPTIHIINSSDFSGIHGVIEQIRLVHGSTYEGVGLDVYIKNLGDSAVRYVMEENYQDNGWTTTNFESVDADPPSGYTMTEISCSYKEGGGENNVIDGIAASSGNNTNGKVLSYTLANGHQMISGSDSTTLRVRDGSIATSDFINASGSFRANTSSQIIKYGLYGDDITNYGIGMKSGLTFGGLNSDWGMTFVFNNDDDRGFHFRDASHNDSQGAMALTTNGKLTVAHSARIGYGESDTTTPGATFTLDVSGSIGLTDGTAGAPAYSFVNDTNSGMFRVSSDVVGIAAAGNSRFTVKGNGIKAPNGSLGVNTDPNSTDGMIHATNDIVAFSSDKRLKENIRPIENALDKIDKLSGFVYNWNEKANKEAGYDMDKDYVGVFAQDVEKVQPEAVELAPFDNDSDDNSISGKNYLTVQYEKLVPLLIESIKELKKEIEELKK